METENSSFENLLVVASTTSSLAKALLLEPEPHLLRATALERLPGSLATSY